MSGFDEKTGWCHFINNRIVKYYKKIDDESDYVDSRFQKRNIPSYIDLIGGLHAKCTAGEMCTILSGKKYQCSSKILSEAELEPEYINVTIVGQKLNPKLAASRTNKLLEKIEFQVKTDGIWTATEKGSSYSKQAFSVRGGKPFLNWSWNIIKILQVFNMGKNISNPNSHPPGS